MFEAATGVCWHCLCLCLRPQQGFAGIVWCLRLRPQQGIAGSDDDFSSTIYFGIHCCCYVLIYVYLVICCVICLFSDFVVSFVFSALRRGTRLLGEEGYVKKLALSTSVSVLSTFFPSDFIFPFLSLRLLFCFS
jgi:hypothetical protein